MGLDNNNYAILDKILQEAEELGLRTYDNSAWPSGGVGLRDTKSSRTPDEHRRIAQLQNSIAAATSTGDAADWLRRHVM